MKAWFLLLLIIPVLATAVSAQVFLPYQDAYVNDFAKIFSAGEISQLRSLLLEVRQNTTAEVVIVTVEETAPLTPAEYATELFNRWGIGKQEKDNGLLLLYAKKENKFWVTTGYGMEGILPDSKIGRMLDDYYVPYRDAGNLTEGITRFTDEVSKVIIDNGEELMAGRPSGMEELSKLILDNIVLVLIGLIFFIAIVAAAFVYSRPKCKNDGQRMNFVRNEGIYVVYECPKCHNIRKKKRRTGAVVVAGGFGEAMAAALEAAEVSGAGAREEEAQADKHLSKNALDNYYVYVKPDETGDCCCFDNCCAGSHGCIALQQLRCS